MAKRRISTQYCVTTAPKKASPAALCFWNKRAMEKYVRRFKKRHPGAPVAIVKERKLRKW